MPEVKVQKSARKSLLKLPKYIHIRVIRSIDEMTKNPFLGVRLHGELSEFYKFRIGDYRIVYRFIKEENMIEVVKIEHRQGVYK